MNHWINGLPHWHRMTSRTTKHTHTRLTALCPGLPGWAGTRMVKPVWILLKQETVNGSGISWAICKSAPRSRQITTPALHHSVFYRPDVLPAAQPTASKHRRLKHWTKPKALTTTMENDTLTSIFLDPPPESWEKGHSLYDGSQMPVPSEPLH